MRSSRPICGYLPSSEDALTESVQFNRLLLVAARSHGSAWRRK